MTDGHRTASRTGSPSSAWAARRSPSTGTRAPTTCCVEAADEAFAAAGVDQGRRRRLLARHRPVGHERHHPGPAARSSRASRSPGSRTTAPPAPRRCARPPTRWPRGAYDVAMAVGVEKVKDSGYQGLNAFPIPNDGTAAHAHRGGHVLDGRAGLRREVRRRPPSELQRRAGPHRVEEPLQRRPQPAGPVPQGDDASRQLLRDAAGGRRAVGVRLRRRGRRRGGGHRRAGPRTPTATPTSRSTSRRCRSSPATARASSTPTTTTRRFPEIVALRAGRLRAGRHHRSAAAAGHGRGARLLHPDRAGADGGPRLLRAGHGVEGGARRHVRPRRRPAGQPRRRPQELRPPGRRVRACG